MMLRPACMFLFVSNKHCVCWYVLLCDCWLYRCILVKRAKNPSTQVVLTSAVAQLHHPMVFFNTFFYKTRHGTVGDGAVLIVVVCEIYDSKNGKWPILQRCYHWWKSGNPVKNLRTVVLWVHMYYFIFSFIAKTGVCASFLEIYLPAGR